LTTALSLVPLGVGAAGLGKITVLSALGQTLRAEVDISASREELSSMTARVASTEAFKQAGIEYSSALTTIRLVVDKRADGRPFLSMVSDRPFSEPFLDMLVELNWNSGRLIREYTFLLDPPESQQRPASAVPAPVSSPLAAPMPPPATPEVRREAIAVVPAPAASQTEAREATPSQEKPSPPRPEMKPPRAAEEPQRALKAESAEPLQPRKQSAQRLVKRGDTLSQIANETKPDGVNLDQMLVALFRGNQEAFEGNVNRLKAGKILAIPDSESAASVNADEAKRTISAHAADFNAYSKKLASGVANAVSQKDEVPKRAVSGKIAPKVEDKMPPAMPGKDKLEVSKSEIAAGVAGKAGAGRLAAIEETLIAREKALKDANSRIAELEKNLNDLKKLIELKNQGMAELQKQAQVVKPAAPPSPPAAEIKKPVAAAEKPAEKPAEKATEKPLEAEKKPVPPAAPKPPAVTPVPAAPPAAPAQPSFIDESPEIVYGGAGILALLLFYFGYKRYQQRKDSQADRAEVAEPSSAASASPAGAPTVDSDNLLGPHDFSNLSGIGGNEGDAGVDPVAEANVYLAYGRDVQAEEILLDALKTDPQRHAIHLKLLEIYANRKSNKQFETIAVDLHNQTGGIGIDWETAAGLGRQLDPSNPLYGTVPPVAKGFDPDATLVIKPEEREIDLGDLETTGSAQDELLQSAPADLAAGEGAEPGAPQEELPVSLDFELDLAEPEPATAPETMETTVSTAPTESPGIDIDLGLEVEAPLPAATPAEGAAVDQSSQEAPPLVADFDLDLDLGSKEATAAETTAPPDASQDAAMGLDFNFDLDAGEPAVSVPAPEPVADGHSIDFDLDVPVPDTPLPAASSVDLSSINLDLGEPLELPASADSAESPDSVPVPELDDAASQDVETKLELAQAYEEMGDKEGARELLQEVLNEGNAVQREAARSKLERLG
jgi:pilus assembly protein FimV